MAYPNKYHLNTFHVKTEPELYTIQAAIRDILTRPAAVSVTNVPDVYDTVIPENVSMPCVTFQRISETIDPVTMLRKTMMQVDCYSRDHIQADILAEKILNVLMNHSESEKVTIFSIVPTNTTDLSVPETRLYRVTCDYAIIWRFK